MNSLRLLTIALCIGIILIGIYKCYIWHTTSHQDPETIILEKLKEKPLNHMGIIMDGNRRWAKKQGFKPWIGHQEGIKPVRETIEFCLEYHISTLTLYVFSLENASRPQEELSYLFDTLAQEIVSKEFNQLFEKNIKIKFVGDRTRFPQQLKATIEDIEQKTATHTALVVNLLFFYGGQQEIASAAQKLCDSCAHNHEQYTEITFETFKSHMWSADIPPLDLIIRTAGDQRLSNFLPLQSAYSELFFTKSFWPDLTKNILIDAVTFFLNSKRNFGA